MRFWPSILNLYETGHLIQIQILHGAQIYKSILPILLSKMSAICQGLGNKPRNNGPLSRWPFSKAILNIIVSSIILLSSYTPQQAFHLFHYPLVAGCCIILTTNIKPSDFNYRLYYLRILISMADCEGCTQRDKQYKVLEVELQFEIKKLTEDMALQKVKLELAHQKEGKKWADRLHFVKNERQLENKSWMEKYDAMTQLYEDKLSKTENACQQTVVQAQQRMAVAQKSTVQQSEARLSREVEEIRQESEDYKRKLLLAKEEQKKYLIMIHEEELAKQAEKHKQEVAFLEEEKRQLQQTISGFEAAEQNSKLVSVQISEELVEKKLEAEELRQKIRALEHKIKFFYEAELLNKDKQTAKLKNDHQNACRKLASDFALERQSLAKEMNESIEKMLEKEYVKCMEYEKKLKALDEQREKEIALYRQQLDDLRSTAEERLIPKSQFHEEISTLKGRLSSKEKDIQLAKEQIKQCKLEIENNEEILTKFFKTSTNHTHTAPDIFINTPKKKDYKIKKNRISVSGAGGPFDLPGKFSNVTSMECLDKVTNKDFQSFRIL